MNNDPTQAWIIQQREIQNKNHHQSGLKHWFSRDSKIKQKPWQIYKDEEGAKEGLPCPAGIDKSYWQNLSKREQNWAVKFEPTNNLEERRRLWQEEQALRTAEHPKVAEPADFFTQAVRPVDPFEEPIKRKTRLLQKVDDKNVVALKPHQLLWKIAVNE